MGLGLGLGWGGGARPDVPRAMGEVGVVGDGGGGLCLGLSLGLDAWRPGGGGAGALF